MPSTLKQVSVYATLSSLLEYPREGYLTAASAARDSMADRYPAATAGVTQFLQALNKLRQEEIEELYTRTFDMAPVCNPYVTTYIYGEENFQRGEFMSKLAQHYFEVDFNARGELPDHIGVLLRFTDHLDRTEFADLTEYCLRKPVKEMAQCLEAAHNPYSFLMRALEMLLAADFPGECSHD